MAEARKIKPYREEIHDLIKSVVENNRQYNVSVAGVSNDEAQRQLKALRTRLYCYRISRLVPVEIQEMAKEVSFNLQFSLDHYNYILIIYKTARGIKHYVPAKFKTRSDSDLIGGDQLISKLSDLADLKSGDSLSKGSRLDDSVSVYRMSAEVLSRILS